MLIECKLKREGGTEVVLGKSSYCFNGSDEHVCEVKNPAHIKLLLEVDEGNIYVECENKKESKSTAGDEFKGLKKSEIIAIAKAELGIEIDKTNTVAVIIKEILSARAK